MRRYGFVFSLLMWKSIELTTSQSLSGDALHDFIDLLLDSKSVKNSPPDAPTVISVDIEFISFGDFNEVSMEYEVQMYLRQRWKNSNLSFSEHNHSIIISEEQFSRIWTPDTYFPNEKIASLHQISEPNRLVRIDPDGTVLLSQRLSLTLNCYMDLSNYPMDSQLCPFHLETYRYPTEYLIFKWQKEGAIIIGSEITLPDVVLEDYMTEERTSNYSTGNYSRLTASFLMSRHVGYFVLQIFVPSVLTVVLSWVSFWIDVHAVPARISVGLLTVLTMTTHITGINQGLPRVSYIKAIDIWTTTCLGFVVGGLVEFTLVNVLVRKHAREMQRKNSTKNPGVLAAMNSSQGNEASDATHETSTNIRLGKTRTNVDFIHQEQDEAHEWKCLPYLQANPAISVDVVSRILFPVSFIIFNVIYWVKYT